MNVLDQDIFDRIIATPVPSEVEIGQVLNGIVPVGTSSPSEFIFRGQIRRRPKRWWPPVDEPTAPRHSLEVEDLVPSDYRSMEEQLENGVPRPLLEPTFGNRIAEIRSQLTTYLMQCHANWGDHSVRNWYQSLVNVTKADKLLSIGQHYGFRTHFLDWSSSWEVALWFATHEWNTGAYIVGGTAVVYQLDLQRLSDAEDRANIAIGHTNPSEQFRHVDIQDTPAILAPRANAQRGFSVIGLESPHLLQEVATNDALKVYEFPRGLGPATCNSLTKPQLVPPIDQMADLFDECRQATNLLRNGITWIAMTSPHLNPTMNDANHLFA